MAQISAESVEIEWLVGSTAEIKAFFLIPLLRFALYICLACLLLLFVEWLHVMSLAAVAKIFRKKPAKRYKFEAMRDDLEDGSLDFPMVLVQIPIYNELEVYKISIGAVCNLSWPADRLVVQVLDDSSDIVIRNMIEKECMRWASQGINIKYQSRETRKGYKAGALQEGLQHNYAKECEYVAIFDADFQPGSDFLRRAIPFLVHNPEIGVIQARWTFVNADDCFLTRMQEMTMNYQFLIEEEGPSSIYSFFIFNGTGGIWRISAINDAGGWKDRSTVEDLDLSIRAGLKGWKFVHLKDLEVKSELPSTFKAFLYQQHRWASGSANLFRKIVIEIATNKEVSIWKKLYIIYNIFLIRKMAVTLFTFLFYCVVLPLATLFPEVGDVPKSRAVLGIFIFAIISALVTTPRSLHLAIPWVIFENIVAFHQTKSLFIGLFESKRANEWIVTEKIGDALKNKSNAKSSTQLKDATRLKAFGDRIRLHELLLAVFLFGCGCYGIFFYGLDIYCIYLFSQAFVFTIAGFGYFGTIVPNS